jgi:hypothetical protein
LNGTLEANDTETPFTWTSNTANHPIGNYNITAVAYNISEQKAVSTINEAFIEMPYLEPILILVLIMTGIFIAIPILCAWYMAKKGKNKQHANNTSRSNKKLTHILIKRSTNF